MIARPEIEGLRALSVGLVVAYHYFPMLLPGGYVGVDVFFVISGYLITLSLLEQAKSHQALGSFVIEFLARRARRLLPNALLVLVLVAMTGLVWLSDLSIKKLGADVFAGASYSINWLLILRSVDYLRWDETQASALLHYWSLAVEEQFYFVWPVLLYWALHGLGAARSRPPAARVGTLAAVLALVSLLYCVWLSGTQLTLGFFASPSRAWELLAGAWLAAHMRQSSAVPLVSGWLQPLVLAGAVALIVASAMFLSDDSSHPGWITLWPVLGAVGVLAVGGATGGSWMYRWMSSGPMRYLGGRSYSIYLWHWPVLVLSRQLFGPLEPWALWASLAVSLLLAEAACRWIELPSRFKWGRGLAARRVVFLGLAGSVCVAGLGLMLQVVATHGTRALIAATVSSTPSTRLVPHLVRVPNDLPSSYRNGCHLGIEPVEPLECGSGAPVGSPTAVLFGDSHAAQWLPALDPVAAELGLRLHSWTKSSCPSADVSVWNRVTRGPNIECDAWRLNVLRRIEAMRPRFVLVSNLIEDATVLVDRGSGRQLRGQEAHAAFEEGLVRTLERLRSAGIAVVVIRDTPRPRADVLDCLYSATTGDTCELRLAAAMTAPALDVAAARRTASILWDFSDQICPGARCPVLSGDPAVVVYRDSNHLTASFVQSLAPTIAQHWAQAARSGGNMGQPRP